MTTNTDVAAELRELADELESEESTSENGGLPTICGYDMKQHVDTFSRFEFYVDGEGHLWITGFDGQDVETGRGGPRFINHDEMNEIVKAMGL